MSERHTALPIFKHNQQFNHGQILNAKPAKQNYCYFSRIEKIVPTETTNNEKYMNVSDKESITHLNMKRNKIETNKETEIKINTIKNESTETDVLIKSTDKNELLNNDNNDKNENNNNKKSRTHSKKTNQNNKNKQMNAYKLSNINKEINKINKNKKVDNKIENSTKNSTPTNNTSNDNNKKNNKILLNKNKNEKVNNTKIRPRVNKSSETKNQNKNATNINKTNKNINCTHLNESNDNHNNETIKSNGNKEASEVLNVDNKIRKTNASDIKNFSTIIMIAKAINIYLRKERLTLSQHGNLFRFEENKLSISHGKDELSEDTLHNIIRLNIKKGTSVESSEELDLKFKYKHRMESYSKIYALQNLVGGKAIKFLRKLFNQYFYKRYGLRINQDELFKHHSNAKYFKDRIRKCRLEAANLNFKIKTQVQ